jgi:7-carboxy-7-deazaguanine synthase
MPQQPTLRVTEVFASVQGEGLRQGEPTIFIRLAGCNLACAFCDTKRARRGGRRVRTADLVDEVLRVRSRAPVRWVCLTGGEPLAQEVGPLVRALKRQGFSVQVETNGTFEPRPAADWYTISPKPPAYAVHPAFSRKAREVKLVVTRSLTRRTVEAVREAFPSAVPVLLQPQSNATWSMAKAARLLERSLRAGVVGLRLSVQLHKIYRLR